MTLTAWFKLNQSDPAAHIYFYRDIPLHYVFNEKNKIWTPRKRFFNVIGRVYSVSPRDIEKFCLRLLLNNVKGATGFDYLLTVQGVRYETFKEAAASLGLLRDDSVWEKTMQEASTQNMASELRSLFVTISIFCNPTSPTALFEKFKEQLSEDYIHRGHSQSIAEDLCLCHISELLKLHGKNLQQLSLRIPDINVFNAHLVEMAHSIDRVAARRQADLLLGLLNVEQKSAFYQIMNSVNNIDLSQRQFFLDGPGGTGKTFLYKVVTYVLQSQGKTVVSVASTGIAATLLIEGKTFHSTFKLYPPITETTTSQIKLNSPEAKVLKECALIIWDEATMTPSHALDAVDKLLRELMEVSNKPFGGKVMLLRGDFRQCLPVVKHGHRVAIVQSTVKSATIWPSFHTLRLTVNMRAQEEQNLWFPEWLIKLGNGELTNSQGFHEEIFEIPPGMILPGH